MTDVMEVLGEDRVLVVVRAPAIADARDLCASLVAGGIRVVELTFTTPDVERHLSRAAGAADAIVGAGTVLTVTDALRAVDAGAQFIVTPGLGPDAAEIVRIAHDAGVPVAPGTFTASEVMTALSLEADAVKVFPAHHLGPRYLKDLLGPFPGARLLPSGGVNAGNASAFLAAGAFAVSAGTDVVPPTDVAEGNWSAITAKAAAFRSALTDG